MFSILFSLFSVDCTLQSVFYSVPCTNCNKEWATCVQYFVLIIFSRLVHYNVYFTVFHVLHVG